MKRRLSAQYGFLRLGTSITLLVGAAAACSILSGALLAFFRPESPAKVSPRTLTFAERVAYQRAIEQVYWRYRIWPRNRGEQPDPKPSLDVVMSQAQLEKKVEDYLRKSEELEEHWDAPSLPSNYSLKWTEWRSAPSSQRCCVNSLKLSATIRW